MVALNFRRFYLSNHEWRIWADAKNPFRDCWNLKIENLGFPLFPLNFRDRRWSRKAKWCIWPQLTWLPSVYYINITNQDH